MEGTNFLRVGLALGHMLLRPRDAGRWLLDNVFIKKTAIEQGLPWMSWRAIDYLQDFLSPGLRVFEWGGGGSTIFFADHGCHVTTVESSQYWKDIVLTHFRERKSAGSVDIRYVPAEAKEPQAIRDYVRSIHDGAPWNVVVVDGLEESYVSRVDCLKQVKGAVQKGGIVILDDSYRSRYLDAPTILQGWERKVFRGLGSSRLGVTQTDVYICTS